MEKVENMLRQVFELHELGLSPAVSHLLESATCLMSI